MISRKSHPIIKILNPLTSLLTISLQHTSPLLLHIRPSYISLSLSSIHLVKLDRLKLSSVDSLKLEKICSDIWQRKQLK